MKKCSVCRRPDHDRRSCPLLGSEKPGRQEQVGNKKNTTPAKKVAVWINDKNTKSSHVVDLKEGNIYIDEEGLPVYSADTKKRTHKILSWQEMMRSQKPKRRALKINKPRLRTEKIKYNFKKPKVNWEKPFLLLQNKGLIVCVLLCMVLPLPVYGYAKKVKKDSQIIVEKSTAGFLALQSSTVAALRADLGQAQTDLNLALNAFGEASELVEKEHKALVFVSSALPVIGEQVESRQKLLSAGHHLALGNTYLVKGIDVVSKKADDPSTVLSVLSAHIEGALPQYKQALSDLSVIDESVLPDEYKDSFGDFKLLYSGFVNDLEDITNLSKVWSELVGEESLKRYLLVFQNSHELRPTGGFMGSYAVLDVQKGKIVRYEVPTGGTYDFQGQLDVYVKPPLPLQLANGRWEFQDANWFADFPASAKKIGWFYEQGKGRTIDGVIAINSSVLESLLGVLGPIVDEQSGVVLQADSALNDLQYEVEENYDKESNQPKKVIGSFFELFLNKVSQADVNEMAGLLAQVNKSLKQKEIQMFFYDKTLHKTVSSFGWTGEIEQIEPNTDYLMVVNSNIGGEKSDAGIEQQIEHQAVVHSDGSIVDTVIIKRHHTAKPGEDFYGVNNVDYIRLYVPQGAQLIKAGGFTYPSEENFDVPEDWYEQDKDLSQLVKEVGYDNETGTRITKEFGKTVFGNWVMVMPGETSQVFFTYKLPYKVDLNSLKFQEEKKNTAKWLTAFVPESKQAVRYNLFVQKQSGIDSDFSGQVIFPDDWQPVWKSGQDVDLAINGASFDQKLVEDAWFAVVLSQKN